MMCIGGGTAGAWDASFVIKDLLPGEMQAAMVGAKDKPFKIEGWSQNSSRKVDVFCFDVVFGDFETQPREDSPYANE